VPARSAIDSTRYWRARERTEGQHGEIHAWLSLSAARHLESHREQSSEERDAIQQSERDDRARLAHAIGGVMMFHRASLSLLSFR
jgi:hypothetical protein